MSIRLHAATIYLSTSSDGCTLRVDSDRLISSLGTFTRFKAPLMCVLPPKEIPSDGRDSADYRKGKFRTSQIFDETVRADGEQN